MEDKTIIICPFCKCKEVWYIHASEEQEVYQCSECSRYFKVQASESVNQRSRVKAADGRAI